MDATNQENQPPKKKEQKKKNKTRISFIGRTMPLPYYKKMSVDELYNLIDKRSLEVYTKLMKLPSKLEVM